MSKLAMRVLNGPPGDEAAACERCLCASCEKLCMKCTVSCCPMDKNYVPLIGCPDYVDMRGLSPLRYMVRGGHDLEYKLHLSNSRG